MNLTPILSNRTTVILSRILPIPPLITTIQQMIQVILSLMAMIHGVMKIQEIQQLIMILIPECAIRILVSVWQIQQKIVQQ